MSTTIDAQIMKPVTIKELVNQTICCLVDNPESVQIEEQSGDRTTVMNIIVPKDEVGKIIGKSGRIISAIRTIAENIAAKNGKRINIHIID